MHIPEPHGPDRQAVDWQIRGSAALLDCDGVLVDSIQQSERAIVAWASSAKIDPPLALSVLAGRRFSDALPDLIPIRSLTYELSTLESIELRMAGRTRAAPGAADLVRQLSGRANWAVVTSASKGVSTARLRAAKLPMPPVLVASGDVARGKPDPEGYLLAAQLLGVDSRFCIAVEDHEVGATAAAASGAAVVHVAPTSSIAGAYRVNSLQEVGVSVDFDRILTMSSRRGATSGRPGEDVPST